MSCAGFLTIPLNVSKKRAAIKKDGISSAPNESSVSKTNPNDKPSKIR